MRIRTATPCAAAKAEAELATLLPERIADGDSWHVISHGNIDALSYLHHLLCKPFAGLRRRRHLVHRAPGPDRDRRLARRRPHRPARSYRRNLRNQYGDEYEMVLRMHEQPTWTS